MRRDSVMEQATIQHNATEVSHLNYQQYSTFFVSGRLYGIDVKKVQEIVRPMPMTKIPLSQDFVVGLINLRGQVATAISLHKLFGLEADPGKELMNVICKMDGHLISLLVDDIGDVVEVDNTSYEPTPITIHGAVRKFMLGVHKTDHNLLSVLDIEEIGNSLNQGES